jgi:transcriptional regulator with XRE-family HTH domain
MMVLRNRLNRILHDRGLAEGEVAMVARLDQGHLNRIKNGRVKPTLVTALRIAHALGTPVNQLFYLEGVDADAPPHPARSAADEATHERPGPERALPRGALAAPRTVATSR